MCVYTVDGCGWWMMRIIVLQGCGDFTPLWSMCKMCIVIGMGYTYYIHGNHPIDQFHPLAFYITLAWFGSARAQTVQHKITTTRHQHPSNDHTSLHKYRKELYMSMCELVCRELPLRVWVCVYIYVCVCSSRKFVFFRSIMLATGLRV